MADITFMSWKIQKFGPGKFVANRDPMKGATTFIKNTIPLLRTIADTVLYYGTNMISILEVSDSCAESITANLITYLNSKPGLPWDCITIPSKKAETYCIFYRTGQGIIPVRDNRGELVKGITNKDASGKDLNFQTPHSNKGGRKPGYALFTTTDRVAPQPNVLFTVICYHAMFANNDTLDMNGIKSIPRIGPVTKIYYSGILHDVQSAIISGDFNVDYIDHQNYYGDAEALVHGNGKQAVESSFLDLAKSTLKNTTDATPYPHTRDYRVMAYDNIFARKVENPTIATAPNGVIDMIDNFIIDPVTPAKKPLSPLAGLFNTSDLENGVAITSSPPNNSLDAWHIYKTGVSDHLPVIISFRI